MKASIPPQHAGILAQINDQGRLPQKPKKPSDPAKKRPRKEHKAATGDENAAKKRPRKEHKAGTGDENAARKHPRKEHKASTANEGPAKKAPRFVQIPVSGDENAAIPHARIQLSAAVGLDGGNSAPGTAPTAANGAPDAPRKHTRYKKNSKAVPAALSRPQGAKGQIPSTTPHKTTDLEAHHGSKPKICERLDAQTLPPPSGWQPVYANDNGKLCIVVDGKMRGLHLRGDITMESSISVQLSNLKAPSKVGRKTNNIKKLLPSVSIEGAPPAMHGLPEDVMLISAFETPQHANSAGNAGGRLPKESEPWPATPMPTVHEHSVLSFMARADAETSRP